MVLLRHLLGDVLRRLRLRQGRTLREVSAAARVSLGYLSEVERGQKEASSELLAAICSALGVPLSRVLGEVSDGFALAELQNAAVLGGPQEPPLAGRAAPREPALAGRTAPQEPALTGRSVPPGRELVTGPAAVPGARHALLEGPVPAREILVSRPLSHEMIGGRDGRAVRRPFGDGSSVGNIKDMVSV